MSRSQPQGLSNGSVCEQGDRDLLCKAGDQSHHGMTLRDLGLTKRFSLPTCLSRNPFSLCPFPGVDTLLSPEMKSTGEVMGIDENFGLAFAKSQLAAGQKLPLSGTC